MRFAFEFRVRRVGGLGVVVSADPKKRGENSTKKSAHNAVCGLVCWFIIWARLEAGGKNGGVDTTPLAFIYMALVSCWDGDFSRWTRVLVETESVSCIVSDRRRFSWWSDYGWIAG